MTPSTLQSSIIDFALAQVGKSYDYRGLFGFLTRKDHNNAEKWFCSELVSAAFTRAAVPLLRNDPCKIAPGDLATSPLLFLRAVVHTAPTMGVPQYIPGEGLRVGLYRGRSLVSRCIRFRTWSDYSHASLILPDQTVIEALPRGVVHTENIAEFHNAETPVEIWQPNWPAVIAASFTCASFLLYDACAGCGAQLPFASSGLSSLCSSCLRGESSSSPSSSISQTERAAQ